MFYDRQSLVTWRRINEKIGRKITTRTKQKASSPEERLHNCKEHMKNLLGNPSEITDKSIQKNHLPQTKIKTRPAYRGRTLNIIEKN